jgi:hypothetical protein
MNNVVIVEWVDSQMHRGADGLVSAWMSNEEFVNWCKEPLVICRSAGFLAFENDDVIVITQTTYDGDMADSTQIPKVAIKTIHNIDVSNL